MMTTIRNLCIVLSMVMLSQFTHAQRKQRLADEATKAWHYDLECVGTGKQGFKLVKVWSYSKKPKYAISQSWKNAVHGIIFKGFSGTGRTCTGFRPLANNPMSKEQYDNFFKEFFLDSGDYSQYVTDAADGIVDPQDVLKVNKRTYKIGVVVNVNVNQLRKRLEQEGIINGLANGF